MLKILQVRHQQHVNHELPDVQPGFRKGGGTGDLSQRDLNFQNKQTAHTTQQEKKQKPNLKKVEDLNRYFSKKENKGLTRA